MVRSESALELRGGRKTSLPALSASQMQKSVFRKSMPMHLEVIFRCQTQLTPLRSSLIVQEKEGPIKLFAHIVLENSDNFFTKEL